MEQPNILWICTDQQRADTIHALGNAEVNTPTLDRLVNSGVVFDRAYTQCPICTPSRASFLTGRYPTAHRVMRNGVDRFPDDEALVTKIFADHGYDCGLIGKLHLSRAQGRTEVRPRDGYRVFRWSHHPYPDWEKDHAYDVWLRKTKNVDPRKLYAGMGVGSYLGAGVPADLHQTTWCADEAVAFVTEERDKPWLLSLNLFDPHPPFDPPAEYLNHYDHTSLSFPLFRESDLHQSPELATVASQTKVPFRADRAYAEIQERGSVSSLTSKLPESFDPRYVKACYYAMIELIDAQIARVLQALETTQQLENTVVVFMSDHGELLGDHGLLYKGCRFYEGLVRVPLIIAMPSRYAKATRRSALVELVDVAPTLLDIAGIEVPDRVQGKSLLPLLSHEATQDYHKETVISHYYATLNLPSATHATMCFDGTHKSVAYHGTDFGELYDLSADPGEFENLWRTSSGTQLKGRVMRRHLQAIMGTIDPGVARTGSY